MVHLLKVRPSLALGKCTNMSLCCKPRGTSISKAIFHDKAVARIEGRQLPGVERSLMSAGSEAQVTAVITPTSGATGPQTAPDDRE